MQKIKKFAQFTSRPPGCFDAFAKIFLSWNYYNCASKLSNRTVHFDCFTLLRVLYFNYMYCVYMHAWKLKYKKKFNQYKNAGAVLPICGILTRCKVSSEGPSSESFTFLFGEVSSLKKLSFVFGVLAIHHATLF